MNGPRIHEEHRQQKKGNFPYNRRVPGWLLDKIAEEKLGGGYTSKRNPVCPNCFVRKATNGTCSCDL